MSGPKNDPCGTQFISPFSEGHLHFLVKAVCLEILPDKCFY